MARSEGTKDRGGPPAKLIMSDALMGAINVLSAPLLRTQLLILCEEVPIVIRKLEDRLLVPSTEIVPYHADSASEGVTDSGENSDENGEEESEDVLEDSDASDDSNPEPPLKKRKSNAIGTEAFAARFQVCENCKEHFDVTTNQQGNCTWHSGSKVVDYETETWWDHDEDCHGRCEDLADESDYEEGFVWECCKNSGKHRGCKATKHKAKVNFVVSLPPSVQVATGKKRKAGDRR